MHKDAIRRGAQAKRDAVGEVQRQEAAQKIAQLFFQHPNPDIIRTHRIIAAYAPIRGEINPMPLLVQLHQRRIQCALPVVQADRLIFRQYAPNDPLTKGAYGILEPSPDKPALNPSLILTPLLAFDKNGTRLGYGVGHYDRALPEYDALRVGVAFASQELERLPREPHDIPLNAVLTEKAWLLL